MGFFERFSSQGRSDERRHREQIRWARRDVRWGRIGVLVAVVALLVSVTIAVLQDGDGGDGDDARSATDTADDPLTVSVRTIEDHCAATWFVPRPMDQISFGDPAGGSIDWSTYPAAEGGSPAAPFEVVFTVQGRSDAEVELTDLVVHVVERRDAPEGVLLDDSCGDVGAFHYFEVDLDSDPPAILSVFNEGADPGDVPEVRAPLRLPYEVALTDAEAFLVTAWAVDCDCDWNIEVFWQSQGRSGSLIVDDNGRPFRTVGLRRATTSCWSDGSQCESPIPDYLLPQRPSAYATDSIPIGD